MTIIVYSMVINAATPRSSSTAFQPRPAPSDSSATRATSLAVDPFGNAYVAGYTLAENLPVTLGAYQTVFGGGGGNGLGDGFIAKFGPGGRLALATYQGASRTGSAPAAAAPPIRDHSAIFGALTSAESHRMRQDTPISIRAPS